jgi:AraC-like DNA-binding protein
MIPSNQSHESDVAVPLIATFWVEPTTGEAGRMQELQPTLPIVPLPQSKLGAIVPRLLEGWREPYSSQRAAALVAEIVQILAPRERPGPVIDGRVARAMEIHASAPRRQASLSATAAAVALSPSRLAHLFTPAVGIPPRRHLLWLRLRDALRELAGGASITRAAHAADFADGPHFTRTFRRMLGFTPSAALKVSQFVQDAPAGRC